MELSWVSPWTTYEVKLSVKALVSRVISNNVRQLRSLNTAISRLRKMLQSTRVCRRVSGGLSFTISMSKNYGTVVCIGKITQSRPKF